MIIFEKTEGKEVALASSAGLACILPSFITRAVERCAKSRILSSFSKEITFTVPCKTRLYSHIGLTFILFSRARTSPRPTVQYVTQSQYCTLWSNPGGMVEKLYSRGERAQGLCIGPVWLFEGLAQEFLDFKIAVNFQCCADRFDGLAT